MTLRNGWCFGIASMLAWGSYFVAPLPQPASPCRVQTTVFDGWKARELSNAWVRLTFVPQLGGRLMQVTFNHHPYLFVNPKYKGRYISPSEAKGTWINYGGDKLWPLPEGRDDDQHWPGPVSDLLDDGEYEFNVISQGATCTIRLDGPADTATGLQYSREITVESNTPEISFHSIMRNASQRPIRWSVQSVTQYDTADRAHADSYNRDFWAFAPINPLSTYFGGYQVRAGRADDPSFSTQQGMFWLHWLYLENEVWLDSTAGWLAVVDAASGYGMIERTDYATGAEYPGKASMIFYKNGAALELDPNGSPVIRSSNPADAPFYMEAELNSPMVRLQPGESYSFDTQWVPLRVPTGQPKKVTSAGVVVRPLQVIRTTTGIKLSGALGVFVPGELVVRFSDEQGLECGHQLLATASPSDAVDLDHPLQLPDAATRLALHLVDSKNGTDYGVLDEAAIPNLGAGS